MLTYLNFRFKCKTFKFERRQKEWKEQNKCIIAKVVWAFLMRLLKHMLQNLEDIPPAP